jgi:hypothetical protein
VIADDDVALEASTAENTLREAMHPADQFIAFQGMVEAASRSPTSPPTSASPKSWSSSG